MKNPGLAAVFSFLICGLGQIYNGQILKGLILMACYAVSWWMTILLVGWAFVPVLWIWGIYDAYRNAEKINNSKIGYL